MAAAQEAPDLTHLPEPFREPLAHMLDVQPLAEILNTACLVSDAIYDTPELLPQDLAAVLAAIPVDGETGQPFVGHDENPQTSWDAAEIMASAALSVAVEEPSKLQQLLEAGVPGWMSVQAGAYLPDLLSEGLPLASSVHAVAELVQGARVEDFRPPLATTTVKPEVLDKYNPSELLIELAPMARQLGFTALNETLKAYFREKAGVTEPRNAIPRTDAKAQRTDMELMSLSLVDQILLDLASCKLSFGKLRDDYLEGGPEVIESMARRSPGVIALWAAAKDMREAIDVQIGRNPEAYLARYNINARDFRRLQGTTSFVFFGDPDRLGDLALPFCWAAGVANTVVEEYPDLIAPRALAEITLSDWARIIGSSWFADLMTSLAFTGPGFIREFGATLDHYIPGAFRTYFDPLIRSMTGDSTPFQRKTVDGTASEVTLAQSFTHALRAETRPNRRCPAAVSSFTVPEQTVHLYSLRATGFLDSTARHDDHFRAEQNMITKLLGVFADRLTTYDQQYGTPLYDPANIRVIVGDQGVYKHSVVTGMPTHKTLNN